MMLFLLWTVLIEPLPPANVELQLYRNRDELPAHWLKQLPANFDFAREQVATRASFEQGVQLSAPVKQSQHRELLLLWARYVPQAPRCPPCSGVQRREDEALTTPEMNPLGVPLALYRVPRSVSRVREVYDERELVTVSPCPICRAP